MQPSIAFVLQLLLVTSATFAGDSLRGLSEDDTTASDDSGAVEMHVERGSTKVPLRPPQASTPAPPAPHDPLHTSMDLAGQAG
eukprot:COSAG02_NODE_27737_length_603_cov_1.571429_1_plen_82_part_10